MKTDISSPASAGAQSRDIAKKYLICLIAPAASAVLLFAIYYIFKIFPFSSDIFNWGDMSQQSIPLLIDFKRILTGQFDMFLNTANAAGMSFWGVFFFFLASPINFLVALVPVENMYFFAAVLVLIKIAISSFTGSLFFRRQFSGLNGIQANALGVMYAFCGFAMLYYQNIIWLDVMWIFPILLMGLFDLVNKQKILLFTIALSATVAINYYMSYMVVVFLLLFMGAAMLFFAKKEVRGRVALRFIISSVIAALLTAVVWLPSLLQYFGSARGGSVIDNLTQSAFITSINTTITTFTCTATIVASIVIFFIAKMFRDRKAVGVIILLGLTTVPVFIEPINKMWHMGSYMAFPTRYGYITVMMGLILTAMFLSQTEKNRIEESIQVKNSKPLVVVVWILTLSLIGVGITILYFKNGDMMRYVSTLWLDSNQMFYMMLFGLMGALVYFMLYIAMHNYMISNRMGTVVLCVVVIAEVLFNSCVFIGNATRPSLAFTSALEISDKTETSDMYRTKQDKKLMDVNLIGALGYNTLAHYTSLTDADFMSAMKKLGYSSYWMEVGSNGGTLLSDILTANRYTIYRNTDVSTEDAIAEEAFYCIKENADIDSFGVTFTTNDIESYEELPYMGRLELQNRLATMLFDCKNSVVKIEPEKLYNAKIYRDYNKTVIAKSKNSFSGYIEYTINVKGKRTLYFDLFDEITNALVEHVNNSFSVTVNGNLVDMSYPNQQNNGILKLGEFENERVTVLLSLETNITFGESFGVYSVNEEQIAQSNAKKDKASFTRSGNTITGTVKASSDNEYLLIPITHQKGYTAKVNGNDAQIYKVLDAFMAVKLDKGENTVTLSYIPDGFVLGLVVSVIGLALLVLWAIIARKRIGKNSAVYNKIATVVILVASSAAVVVIYIMPVVINLAARIFYEI